MKPGSPQVIVTKCGAYTTTIEVKHPSLRYLDDFVKLKCAPDLLAAKVFPNAKEVTESMAAFVAVRRAMKTATFADENIVMVDVGSGARPRTAALFACMTNWNCIAVDPKVTDGCRVRRVFCRKEKIQNTDVIKSTKAVVVTAVHAHVKLPWILEKVVAPTICIVAMPCCQPLDLPEKPLAEYEDLGIWSPKRLVKVWKF